MYSIEQPVHQTGPLKHSNSLVQILDFGSRTNLACNLWIGFIFPFLHSVSATRTPSCERFRRTAKLGHDQAHKEAVGEVVKAGCRAGA
jgi:hypothetical protein